jgi:hypothetical protein
MDILANILRKHILHTLSDESVCPIDEDAGTSIRGVVLRTPCPVAGEEYRDEYGLDYCGCVATVVPELGYGTIDSGDYFDEVNLPLRVWRDV